MPEEIELRLDETTYNGADVISALAQTLSRVSESAPAPWHLDMSGGFITMVQTPMLVAVYLDSKSRGQPGRITLPAKPDVLKFCHACGLSRVLTGSVSPIGPEDATTIIPIRQFRRAHRDDPSEIISLLRTRMGLNMDQEDLVRICVNEAIQNVEDHAHSAIGAIMGAQFFANPNSMFISVADCGIGIATSLRQRYPEFADAKTALEHVVKGGYTAKSRLNNLGEGISNLGAIVINQFRGQVVILSENGITAANASRWEYVRALPFQFHGTAINLTLRFD